MAQNKEQQYRFFRELASAQNLDLTESVFATLQDQGKGDADRMTDILMNWMMDDPAMKELMMEDRKRRQGAEEEARKKADEERKKAEEERKKRDAEFIRLQEEAYQRLKKEREQELQRRAAEEAKKKADEEAQKRVIEDAQKKVKDEEDRRRKAKEEEEAKRFADEARKFAEEEARRRLAESQLKRDSKAAEEIAARKLKEEEEAKKKAAAAAAQKLAEEEAAKKVAAKVVPAPAPAPAVSPAPAAAPAPAVSDAKKKEDQAEYEKRLAELEQRLAEFEKARTSNSASPSPSNKDNSISSPKVCILTDNSTTEAAVAEVTAFLGTKGVKAADIRVVNASNDFELVAIVKDRREKLEFPFVLVQSNAIGTLAELQAIASKIGVLEALLAGEKVDPAVLTPKKSNSTETPPELRLGIYDYGVTVGEYTLKAVLLPIVAPYRLLSWAFGGKQPELEKGEDFDVLQSNWYWRHQLRTLRFTAEHIIRLRPGYNDVRAAHRYEDVKEIKLIDPTYFTISYREGGSDWYRTTPQDVRRVCEIICLKNRNVPNPLK